MKSKGLLVLRKDVVVQNKFLQGKERGRESCRGKGSSSTDKKVEG